MLRVLVSDLLNKNTVHTSSEPTLLTPTLDVKRLAVTENKQAIVSNRGLDVFEIGRETCRERECITEGAV